MKVNMLPSAAENVRERAPTFVTMLVMMVVMILTGGVAAHEPGMSSVVW